MPHMLKWSINFLESAPTPSISESPQYSLLGTAECGDVHVLHPRPSKLYGCYHEDTRNGHDPILHCLGWKLLSLCAATAPEISEATSPQSTAVAWAGCGMGKNTCLSPWCCILVESQRKLACLPASKYDTEFSAKYVVPFYLKFFLSPLGSTIHPKLGSVQFSRSVVSNSLQPHELPHKKPPCPSPTPEVYPNSCPSSQ